MTPEQYIADLLDCTPEGHPLRNATKASARARQRVYYTELNGKQSISLQDVIQQYECDSTSNKHAVCVVEDITTEWIGALGAEWGIEKDFFLDHASNVGGSSLWKDVNGHFARQHAWDTSTIGDAHRIKYAAVEKILDAPAKKKPAQHNHIEGVLPHIKNSWQQSSLGRFRRRLEYDAYYGWQANTRMSYYRVSQYLYLFLVDGPVSMDPESSHLLPARLSLWVPYSRNRGGLPIPQLYKNNTFSLFDTLQSFFSHAWHMNVLFATTEPIDFIILSHFLAASVWLTNVRWIDSDIKRIAFKDIRKPNVQINNRLHDRRQDLDTLRSEVLMAKTWIMPEVVDLCGQDRSGFYTRSPKETFEQVYKVSDDLERFLMDTFQLLISSISILDSQTSIQHAQRSSHLATLATVYVPLSFVTGIFGMNMREFNDSRLPLWMFALTLVIVGAATAGALWLLRALKHSEQKGAQDSSSSTTA